MRSLAVPESREDQTSWLESEIMGTELHRLAVEFASLSGSESNDTEPLNPTAFDTDTLVRVRDRGLAALSNSQFTSLLVQPQTLLNIQQDVLVSGGAYWSTIDPPEDLNLERRIDRVRSNLREGVAPSTPVGPTSIPRSTWRSNLGWSAIASLATAACLILVFTAIRDSTETAQIPKPDIPPTVADASTAPIRWGFEKFASDFRTDEANLAPPLDRAGYLRELASAAQSWSTKRPDTVTELAIRIGQFRMGCSAILLSEHRPLPDSDRKWLRQRCETWASALDRHLVAIESGRPVLDVRGEVDSTAVKIAAALIGRAETPAT
ncbi:hypothetical protein Poly51_45290 [Rubripirellula tenax]|uniref:Uncharacterized protein n=1 Tax=Rubripirellula tenax TaxID=2528015 RepID=A0A5C6EIL1_9BACT|nr:hypothetical protein [Rubripirellula tenax]TWU48628.1 hypothetical protein Poly51_45290 [Rubripirellula tenax]